MSKQDSITGYMVPAAPFRRIVETRVEQEREAFNENPLLTVGLELFTSPGDDVDLRDPEVEAKAEQRLSDLITREFDTMHFDLADKIVTRLLGPIQWREVPELAEIYDAVNLLALDISAPTSEGAIADTLAVIGEHRSPKAAAAELGVSYYALRQFLKNNEVAVA